MYHIFENFFTEQEAQRIQMWADQLEQTDEQVGKWMIYHEQSGLRARIENFIPYNDDIRAFLNSKVLPKLEELVKQKMNLFKDKLNWKYGGGKGFAPHQDQPAWTDFPPRIYYTVALFGNNSTVENGCLQFSDAKVDSILPYDKDGNGSLLGDFVWNPIVSTPRDLVIFDSYVPHMSEDNTTTGSRRIFYFTYNKQSDGDFYSDYVDRKRKEFPPDIERKGNLSAVGTKYNLANPII